MRKERPVKLDGDHGWPEVPVPDLERPEEVDGLRLFHQAHLTVEAVEAASAEPEEPEA